MLNNLRAELVRKGYSPAKTLSDVLGCNERTVRNKLSGVTSFTVDEAIKIMTEIFPTDNFTVEYLFAEKSA